MLQVHHPVHFSKERYGKVGRRVFVYPGCIIVQKLVVSTMVPLNILLAIRPQNC
jgi:hypothetical protein